MGGHERGVIQGAARRADPVLGAAELAGVGPVSADATHEPLVKLADQAERERQLLEPGDSILERDHVVRHLSKVVGAAVDDGSGFRREQLAECRLGTLDPAREHGLAADEGPNQEVWVGETASLARQAADGAIGIRERSNQTLSEFDPRGQGIRDEGGVSLLGPDRSTCGLAGRSGSFRRR